MYIKVGLIFLVLVMVCGCRYGSWIVLENPEFPDALRPTELNADLLKKYSAGEVIVHPFMPYLDSELTMFYFLVAFYSKTRTPVVSIKTVTLSVNGVKVEYGKGMINARASAWDTDVDKLIEPFYSASIEGGPIDRPQEEMVKARVDVSFEVLIKEKSGKITEKKFDTYFLPKKTGIILFKGE